MKPRTPPVLITFALVCFALVQNTQAVSPPPDGGYPGGNTAEGQNALLSLTSGTWNTAVGFASLKSNTIGNFDHKRSQLFISEMRLRLKYEFPTLQPMHIHGVRENKQGTHR